LKFLLILLKNKFRYTYLKIYKRERK